MKIYFGILFTIFTCMAFAQVNYVKSDTVYVLEELPIEAYKDGEIKKYKHRGSKKGSPHYLVLSGLMSYVNKVKIPQEYQGKKLIAIEYFFTHFALDFPKCNKEFSLNPLVFYDKNTFPANPNQVVKIPENYKGRYIVELSEYQIFPEDGSLYIGFQVNKDKYGYDEPCRNKFRVFTSDAIGYHYRNGKFSEDPFKKGTLKLNLYFQ